MILSDRLRELREEKNLSQGDIENRTGLFRCYISRVENGHTVPGIDTLTKLAAALEVPLWMIFYEGEEPPATLPSLGKESKQETAGDRKYLRQLASRLQRMKESDRKLLLQMARGMSRRKKAS
jgi:transcriptional regulator with XRE-family HTH domain